MRIVLPRCSTGSGRKRCARSPQFSPHSPNAALLTHFDSTTSFSHSCELGFSYVRRAGESCELKDLRNQTSCLPNFTGEIRVNGCVANYMKTEELFWSGRRDLNSGPPAPKAGSSPLGSPSFPISNLITEGLDPEMVVDGCGWKCLRMHGVPTPFPTAKTERISDHSIK